MTHRKHGGGHHPAPGDKCAHDWLPWEYRAEWRGEGGVVLRSWVRVCNRCSVAEIRGFEPGARPADDEPVSGGLIAIHGLE